jgi:hypothetical protein
MGYPVVTRLGLNQFWYKHWYGKSTSLYFYNFKQDLSFIKLFKMYLNYGLTFSSPVFFHEFFFNNNYKKIRLDIIFKNLKYFRRFYFSNYNLGIEHSYFLRYRTGEYFPLRLWIIKYSNWLILSFNCFKPVKKKYGSNIFIKEEFYAVTSNLLYNRDKSKYNRFKLVFLFLKKYNYGKSSVYNF